MHPGGEFTVKRFRISNLPHVVKILQDTDEFRGVPESVVAKTLYQRFKYGKWINRIERSLKNGSLKFLFTDTYDLTAFVAEDAQRTVVGVIIAYPASDDSWLLYQIVVHQNYRRRGIGYQLMKRFVQHVKHGGAKEIQLYVNPTNLGAMELYRKFGFIVADKSIKMVVDLAK